MKTAIVTGANGFIGSHVLYRLMARGWRLAAIGRGTQRNSWPERVLAAVKEVGTTSDWSGQLTFGELNFEDTLKLPFIAEPSWSPDSTVLFHIAGDTHFRPPDPEAQRRINVDVPLRLAAALKGKIGRIVHVSTAYVAGKRTGVILEDELDCGQAFWNSYEKSKFDAEVALSRFCAEEGIALVIIRPSIITNDRQFGHASTFTHLNALVEVVSRLQDYYGLADGQVVSKTVRLIANAQARPNLAPIDSIVEPLLQISASPTAAGKMFHLCHPHPQTNAEIMDLICEAYRVRSLLALEYVRQIGDKMSHTEEMVARSLKVYSPYLNTEQEFDLHNSRSIVPNYDAYFTPIDLPYLHKVIAFQRSKHQLERAGKRSNPPLGRVGNRQR